MTYDNEQLKKDLSRIVAYRGERKPNGFYTIGVFVDEQVKIVDRYTDPNGPEVYTPNNVRVNYQDIKTSGGVGEYILNLVLRIEDTMFPFGEKRVDISL